MKIRELSEHALEDLKFRARSTYYPCIPIADPPTKWQLQQLRYDGIIIGPEQQVYRVDFTGKLRECAHGVPCRYECGGLDNGSCTQQEVPKCGVPDGACMLTREPCHSGCSHSRKTE